MIGLEEHIIEETLTAGSQTSLFTKDGLKIAVPTDRLNVYEMGSRVQIAWGITKPAMKLF